jgi:hypothetical protein
MPHPAATDQEVVEHAAEVEAEIRRSRVNQRVGWVALASVLYEFDRDNLWEPLGYESLTEWLAGPEVELTRKAFRDHVRVWRELVVERGVGAEHLFGAEFTKVRDALPFITSGKADARAVLADAAALTRSDLIEKYGGDPNAPLAAEDEPEHVKCPTCLRNAQNAAQRTRIEKARAA